MTRLTILSSLLLVACGGGTDYYDDSESIQSRLDAFEASTQSLATQSTTHVGAVMAEQDVGKLTVAELNWSHVSGSFASDIEESVYAISACTDSTGERVNVTAALATVSELKMELHAHQVGMVTSGNVSTAQGLELNFETRQDALIDKLHDHIDTLTADSDSYSCAF